MLVSKWDERLLWKPWVDLDLVTWDRDVLRVRQKLLDVCDREIRDTDCSSLSFLHESFHCLPSRDEATFFSWEDYQRFGKAESKWICYLPFDFAILELECSQSITGFPPSISRALWSLDLVGPPIAFSKAALELGFQAQGQWASHRSIYSKPISFKTRSRQSSTFSGAAKWGQNFAGKISSWPDSHDISER